RLLSRPPGTLSSIRNGGEGWGEEALQFMESHLFLLDLRSNHELECTGSHPERAKNANSKPKHHLTRRRGVLSLIYANGSFHHQGAGESPKCAGGCRPFFAP